MALYQGRALEPAPRRHAGGPVRRPLPGRPRRPSGAGAILPRVGRIVLVVVGLFAVALLAAQVPWRWLRERVAVVREVRVEGVRYLDAAQVARVAGLHAGDDLLTLDLARARQALLLDPRIARARVTRLWPRGVRVTVVERQPVLLVSHGVPWEVDSSGVLLPPLARGVVADVPFLAGPDFSRLRAGTQVSSLVLRRGLAWVRALATRDLQLAGAVSELDVGDPRSTSLLLMSGTRVRAPAWPPGARALSALRVVLADLEQRGVAAEEVDLRFEDQVIVRPVGAAATPARLPGQG